MSNERKLRLIQVAKEFKVGLNTITDFLQKKGIKTDGSPNTLVEPDVYAVLEKEFGGSRITGNERESIRERISQKQATITLEEAQKQTREEEQEVIIKSNVISVKDELPQPKILGKIDLSPKPKPAPKPVSKPAAEPVPEAAAPKPQPAPQPAAPKTEAAPASETASAAKPEPEAAPKSDNIFRPAVQTLTGPQVLGTMDVSGFTPGNRHKRKRLSKEKVDVTRTPAGSPKPGSNGKSAAQPGRGQGPQSNQPRPGENKKTRKDKLKAPKPVVRPEISDEEVSKQVKDTLARLTSKNAKSKGSKYRKEKREAVAERMNEEFQREEQERSILKVTEFVTVAELATMMNVSATEVITACMNLGLMVSINQRLDAEALVVVAEEFGFKTEFVSADIQEAIGDDEQDSEEDLVPRPPIVTVMGHVDHGKTSLLDNIRKTNVIEGEAGGITQHIGAYSVELNGQKITFLDTPGHEAFTAMRARGAKITDVAIIIVAADDNVMPQTVEAINHAQAAGVPMVFAINKIDKPAANPDHIKEQLSQMNYLVESWGGKYQDQEVSAKKGLNLDKLLEKVLLEAEMLDLKANPNNVVLVDEAYVDFGGESCVPLIDQYENLLVVQTFSKSRQLAGARLGLAMGNAKLIADLNRVKFSLNPYNINRLTLKAGQAALEDTAYFDRTRAAIVDTRAWTKQQLEQRGFAVLDSRSNFLFASTDRKDGDTLYKELKKNGILVRHFDAPRIQNWLRITIGTPEQMQTFMETLDKIMEE